MRIRLLAVVVVLLIAGCVDKLADSISGLNVACGNTCDCAAPFECVDGKCTLAQVKRCTPDVKLCVGEFVGTCKSDGSAFELDATGCPHGCFNGACRTTFCEPAGVYCINSRELTCNEWGLGWDVTGTCEMDGGTP